MTKTIAVMFFCLFSVASAYGEVDGNASPAPIQADQICRAAISIAEVNNKIPGELLQAISLNESGKWNEKEKSLIAWPWTVTVEGKGHYYDDYQQAHKAIRKFQKKGITNIDVGCMQINLAFHGKHFSNLDEVLNPINNVAYGASFLTHLRQRESSWTRAVKFYHSANRMYHEPYRKKVIKTWQNLRKEKMKADKGDTANKVSNLAHWPPKSYKSQKQLETLARSKFGVSSY